ncbi:MAG: Ferric uptake regulation protein [Ignavibacteria bacterium]|nr:Ferric uptake regulation protein [Ignavibacteria bacterium]
MIPEKVKEMFITFLKKNAHRITNERFLILDSALNIEGHFDADELYLKMKNEYLQVSRATVYNTLELMSDCKILTKHNFKGDRTRYETKVGRKPHYHIICINCNKIIEFEYPMIEKIQNKICKENNLEIVDHTFQVFAKCENAEKCDKKKQTNSSAIKE